MIDRSRSKVVERAAALLIAMGEADRDIGVTELSRSLGLSKTATHRILQSLVATGFVVAEDERYRLGGQVLQLGQRVLAQLDIRAEAVPFLRELRDLTGETSVLYISLGDHFLGIDEAVSRHENRFVSPLGRSRSYFDGASSSGVVFLASEPDEVIESYVARLHKEHLERRAVTSPDRLREEIQSARRNGYSIALASAGASPQFNAISFPVANRNEQLIAVIAIIGPAHRWTLESIQTYIMDCKKIIATLCSRIRYLEPLALS